MPKEKALCGIAFHAISMKEHLQFNMASDHIITREDIEEHCKSETGKPCTCGHDERVAAEM